MSAYSVNETTTPEQQQAITTAIMSAITHGETFSVSSPAGDKKGASIAQSIMGAIQSQLKSPTSSTSNNGGLDPSIAGTISDGKMTPNPNSPVQQAQIGGPAVVSSWIETHIANYGLVALGVALAIGALLISQKQTIINVGKQAASLAAVAA